MAAVPIVVPARANERQLIADQVSALAAEASDRDGAVATLLDRLSAAIRDGRHDETRGFAGAVDPRALAELLVGGRSAVWGVLELTRNVLVFAPIAVTWFGLSSASAAYSALLVSRPDLVSKPFLLLWQEGFHGAPAVFSFSTLALIDSLLIGLLIVLSFAIHFHTDLRDAKTRTRMLLKESEIRSLLGHATSLAGPSGIGDLESDAMLSEMVAEERRIYERAMEREQQLFQMENAVAELREAATELARAADTIAKRPAQRPREIRPREQRPDAL